MQPFTLSRLAACALTLLLASFAGAQTVPASQPAPAPAPGNIDPARLSALWGAHGESWSPASRLPDFSHAGYRGGDPIPEIAPLIEAATLGIKADGVTDDAPALQHALDSTKVGTILLPPGRILLGDVVTLRHSNLVLRGSGRDKTTLVIPRSLLQLDMLRKKDVNKNVYSFTGGFILFRGSDRGVKLANLAGTSPRGSSTITLAPPAVPAGNMLPGNATAPATASKLPVIAPGLRVRLVSNVDPALGKLIHGGQDAGAATFTEMKHFIDTVATVVAVEGQTVTLDRPLRLGVDPKWQTELWSFAPAVENAGLESLTFEFPGVPKKGHLQEEGFNAVHMFDVANCWARDIDVIDCDNGFILNRARFCTVENVRCLAAKRTIPTGHHALWASGKSQECLFNRFDIQTQFIHDLTVEGLTHGHVFMNGRGQSLNFDHHRNAPYENLFTNLDAGDGARLWESSGDPNRGPHSGVRETFWNIRAGAATPGKSKPPRLPGFPQANLVGVLGYPRSLPSDPQSTALWVEPIAAKEGALPANLYEAQRERRVTSRRESNP